MLHIVICDDETYFAEKLRKMTSKYLKEKNLPAEIRLFSTGEDFLRSGLSPDVLFMDIRLPGKNGMEIIEHLRDSNRQGQVIFVSSYENYALNAFDLDAVHYLLKPVHPKKLSLALDKAIKHINSNCEKTLLLTIGGTLFRIPMSDILYCEVFDHQIIVHTLKESFQLFDTLNALEQRLDDRFFRCHRSYLINMDAVINKTDGYALVTGGHQVLIARRKQQEFTKRLLKSCRI